MTQKEKDQVKFISVGEMSIGFSEHAIPYTDKLTSSTIKLYLESGNAIELDFLDKEAVKYTEINGKKTSSIICGYTVTSPLEKIFFIDLIVSFGYTKSVSVLLDAEQKIATVLTGVLPNSAEMAVPIFEKARNNVPLTGVRLNIDHASVDSAFSKNTKKHKETEELIGKRVLFVYSSRDTYEHIYLNKNFYTWHCVSGSELGLADTDKCHYFKIADEIYVFIWLEKIVPTLGIVIEDLKTMRSYGKIYGYEEFSIGKVSNFPVGSFATELNKTVYPKK